MNFDTLLPDSSKRAVEAAASTIGTNQQLFNKLLAHALSDCGKTSERAVRVVNLCLERSPKLIAKHTTKILDRLLCTENESLRFNLLKIFITIGLPLNRKQLGRLVNLCFDTLDRQCKRIAQKVYAIEILYKVSLVEPGIKSELAAIIKREVPFASMAFRTRGRQVLKKLGIAGQMDDLSSDSEFI